MIEHALGYLRRGWSVVPLKGKAPCVPWVPWQSKLPSEEQVRAWWTKFPNANIGIITGKVSGLVVIDIDPDKGGDYTQVAARGDSDLVCSTGKGVHLYFTHPGRHVDNRVGILDGVDVRGDGGLVVAPPSIHKSGRQYQWLREGNAQPLPTWVSEPKKDKPTESEDHWLSKILMGVQEGARNDSAAKLAGYLAKKKVPIDVASLFVRHWNHNLQNSLPRHEIERTVESVYATASRRVNGIDIVSKPQSLHQDSHGITNYRALMAQFAEMKIDWLVDDWLTAGTLTIVAAPPGSYKTWLLMDLAISVAGGDPFLGKYKVNNPGPVLVYQVEDTLPSMARRCGSIIHAKYGFYDEEVDPSDEFVAKAPPDIPLGFDTIRDLFFGEDDYAETVQRFYESILEHKPRLVIIDPLNAVVSAEDNMISVPRNLLRPLKMIAQDTGTSFVVAHHTAKGSKTTEREDIHGSQFINASLDIGWQVRPVPDEDNMVVARVHSKVAGNRPETKYRFNIQTDIWPPKYTVEEVEFKPEIEKAAEAKQHELEDDF